MFIFICHSQVGYCFYCIVFNDCPIFMLQVETFIVDVFMVNSIPHNDSLRDISLSRTRSIPFRLNTECSSMFTIMLTCEKRSDDDATLDNIKTSLSFIPGGMQTQMVAFVLPPLPPLPPLFCSVKFTVSCSIPKYAFSSVI